MTKSYYGSICITDILDHLKQKNSCFSKSAKNGKIYCNCMIWEHDEPDEYNNIMALQSSSTKEAAEQKEKKFYLGNFKRSKFVEKPITDKDLSALDDIPELETATSSGVDDINSKPDDDLPF